MSHLSRHTPRALLVGAAVAIGGLLAPAAGRAEDMAGAASAVFWSNSAGNVISSARLDGSGGSDFSFTGTAVSAPSGTAIDALAGVIYWANSPAGGSATISWARLNGPGGTLNTTGATVERPRGLAIDPSVAKRVYWANSAGGPGGNGSISWAALSGAATPEAGDLPLSGSDVTSPEGVAVSPADGEIYWANHAGSGPGPDPGSIMSARTDGSDVAALPITGATINAPAGLALDPQTATLYWANSPSAGSGSISYWNLDTDSGGDLITAAALVDHPEGIAVDPVAGRLYWANSGNGTIAYANLDGSGAATLSTAGATASAPMFPVLLAAPAGTGAPWITGTTTAGSTLTCERGSWAGDVLPAFYYRVARNISWQWSRDGADITGATTTSYTASTPGSYVCREMAKNHAGTTTQASDPFVVSGAPLVGGAAASSVTGTSAVLGGSVVPQYATTGYHFDYGATADYGARVPAADGVVAGSDGAGYPVAQTLSGLEPNRTYHFRLVATNANGTAYGADQTFTTSASPAVATGPATLVTTTGAVLTGSLNPENLAAAYYFEFGPTPAYGSRAPAVNAPLGAAVSDQAVSLAVSGLEPNHTYHFRLVAVNGSGTAYGADRTFTTPRQPLISVRGRIGTVGPSLRLTLGCTGGPGQRCEAALVVRTVERLSADGRRIIGLSARPVHGRSRTVVVAGGNLRLAAGARRDVTLRINQQGRMLRTRFRSLPATVEVTQTVGGRPHIVRRSQATFGADPARVRLVGAPASTSGGLAVLVRCIGTARQRCAAVLAVTTFERFGSDGRTIAGLAPASTGRGRTVTIGRLRWTLRAGTSARRTISLTAAGRALVRRFGRVPATLTVGQSVNGYRITHSVGKVTLGRGGARG